MLRTLNFKAILRIFGFLFILTLAGVLPDGICEPAALKLAAWNIERFGQDGKHHRDDKEMREIVKILYKYDLIAITELMKESELQKAQKLLSEMGREYDYLMSPKVGWVGTPYQEHYAFLYYKGLVSVVSEGETGEKTGFLYKKPTKRPEPAEALEKVFIRPPFWATFRAGMFDFSLIAVHTQPKRSEDECALMSEVYQHVQKQNKDEADVLLVGDFNLEPRKSAFDDLLRSNTLPTMIALFNEKNDRSMIKDHELYDNIFFEREHLSEYLYSGVDKFDETDLDCVPAEHISDHRPVWAVFRIDIDDDDDGRKRGDVGSAKDSNTRGDPNTVNTTDSGPHDGP